jgi:outer membrane immunogenic protein
MKKLLIASIATLALIGTPTFAADMAVKAPPPASAPAYSWTGFYVGANGGYGWKDPTISVAANDPVAFFATCGAVTCFPPASFNIHGAVGGLQAGYNWQVNQTWLVGLETDFDWSHIQGTGISIISSGGFPASFQASENVKWFGTVRARVGFLPLNNFLLFATGGFAYGRVDAPAVINSAGTAGAPPFFYNCDPAFGGLAVNCFAGNSSRTATGFAIGGGGEYMLWHNISVKAEYLFVDLGHGNATDVVAQGTPPIFVVGSLSPSSFTAAYSVVAFHVVRAGLNWKF